MYYYIYDSCLGDKKYYNLLAKIETRLTDLGINGKINRLSFLKNIQQILAEEIRRGLKTAVVVGNDRTLSQVINLAGDLPLTFGFIPVEAKSRIAEILGIPSGEAACDILSSRIVEKLDLGKINNYYFLTSLETWGKKMRLEFDNNFFLNLSRGKNYLKLVNLDFCGKHLASPEDGKLEVLVETEERKLPWKKQTHFSRLVGKKIKLLGEDNLSIWHQDENKIIKAPATIEILPQYLKIIVGKNRSYRQKHPA